jgi:hypothetical protein
LASFRSLRDGGHCEGGSNAPVVDLLLIVAWAFCDLIARHGSVALRERPIELTVMQWGSPARTRRSASFASTPATPRNDFLGPLIYPQPRERHAGVGDSL